MKTLGMDLGTKTLGLAVSDKLGIIANPYKTLRYNDIDELVEDVSKLIAELHIEALVLGYPKNMNNSLGEATLRTDVFKEKLENENTNKAKYETEEAAIKAVCDKSKVEIPSGMVDMEVDHMIQDINQRLSYQGLKLEQYLKQNTK